MKFSRLTAERHPVAHAPAEEMVTRELPLLKESQLALRAVLR
jgi:hypothetical protein